MKKTEFLTNVKEKVLTKDVAISKKDLAVVMEAVEEVVMDAVVAGEDVKPLSFLKIKTVEVPRREGTSALGDGAHWVVEAHREPKAVLAKSFRKMLMK